MAKIPNQNNLIDTINAYADDMNDIVSIVVKAATNKKLNINSDTTNALKNYNEVINAVLGKTGVVPVFVNAIKTADTIAGKNISTKNTYKIIRECNMLCMYTAEMANNMQDLNKSLSNVDLGPTVKTIMQLKNIITAFNTVKTAKGIGTMRKLRIIKKRITKIVEFFQDIANDTTIINTTKTAVKKLEPLTKSVTNITDIINSIGDISITKFILFDFKLKLLKRKINLMVSMCKSLANNTELSQNVINANKNIVKLSDCISNISNTINEIGSTKLNLRLFIKLALMPAALKQMIKIIAKINDSTSQTEINKASTKLTKLLVVFEFIDHLFDTIARTKSGLLAWVSLKLMLLNIKALQPVLNAIGRIRVSARAVHKIRLARMLIHGIALLFLAVIIATPVFAVGALAIWLLVGAVLILKVAMNIITKALVKMAGPRVVFGMIALLLIMGFLTSMAVMMLMIAMIAEPVVRASLWILALFGVITVVVLLSIALGALVIAGIYVIAAALGGLVILATMIGIIASIALMLKLIELINIDTEKIKATVQAIIDCAMSIITTIFYSNEKGDPIKNKEDKNKGIFKSIISFVGGTSSKIFTAAMSIPFLLLTLVSVSIIMLIAAQLRMIQMLDLNPGTIAKNTGIVISTALKIVDTIFKRNDVNSKKSNKSWIVDLLQNFGGSVFTVIEAIMAVAFLSVVMIAITFVLLIAMQLRLLQALNLDATKILQNVDKVIGTSLHVIDSIFSSPDTDGTPSNKHFLIKVLEFVGGPVKIIQAIMAVTFLATAILAISLIQVLALQLKQIEKLELSNDIYNKVGNVISGAQSVIDSIFNRPDNTLVGQENSKKAGLLGRFVSFLEGLGDGVEMIASMGWLSTALISVSMVGKLAEHLKTINTLPDLSGIDKKTVAICNAADKVIDNIVAPSNKTVTNTSRLSILERVNTALIGFNSISSEQIENNTKAVDNYVRFIDKVNTVEVSKLEKSAQMFKQMANFSNSIKGNFEKLAESINEDLMPVLEELKEIMEKVPTAIETNGANVSAAVASTTVAPTTTNVTKQVERENPGMDKKQVEQLVQARLREHANSAANSTASKIDELISLLKGYSGEHVIVQTV